MSTLDRALEYARAGLPVFPCSPRTKQPCLPKREGGKGYKDATTDEAKIRKWWSRWPRAMIGMPTGPASGVVIFDVNVKDGVDGYAAMHAAGLPTNTAQVETPSGGLHLYYRAPDGITVKSASGGALANQFGPGLDTRGMGGYIILPGSINAEGKEYRWKNKFRFADALPIPEHLLKYVAKRKLGQRTNGHCGEPLATSLADAVKKIAAAAPGYRHGELNRQAYGIGQAIAAGRIDEAEARTTLIEAGIVAMGADRTTEAERIVDEALAAGKQASALPQIHILPGELPRVVTEAEDALLKLDREIYQRGGLVVRPVLSGLKAADDRDTQSWRLIPVTVAHMVETLTCAAQFMRFDGRTNKFAPCDAPRRVAETYLAREGMWRLPILAGIATAPFLRADGSICSRPGYDPASCLTLTIDGESFPSVPERPDRDDAYEALALLHQLLSDFPFVKPEDRAVALSGILTALDRRAMPTAPLHGFTAPTAGTGKSLLVDIIAILAMGKLMPVIAQGRTEEELEKRLGASLLAGDSAVSIDNCENPLMSAFLCQALTQQMLNIRILGLSRNVETPVNTTFFATGNGLTIAGDLVRRSLLCSMDAKCERPELREFDSDVLATARSQRGRLVAAGLTILRAWHVAREAGARIALPPFGSFDVWSRRVREPLVWLDAGDACDTVTKVRAGDPSQEALAAVLAQWRERLGIGAIYTVQQIISEADIAEALRVALLTVGAAKAGAKDISNVKLGRWLKKVEGKIHDGLVLRQAGIATGYPTWHLCQA